MAAAAQPERWLVLVHQLPPEPPGLRMRIWRRLQALGALQLKSSVYVLPDSDETREDFEWLVREIEAAGAEATLLRSSLLAGVSDDDCVERFRAAAAAEYAELVTELREIAKRRKRVPGRKRAASDDDPRAVARLRERLAAIVRRDFFAADGREAAAALLAELEGGRGGEMRPDDEEAAALRAAVKGKRWATRAGVHVDRMASAWLVRRYVDPAATFRFVAGREIAAAPGEVRFDCFGGEFTHEADACTFEVLRRRLALSAPGLARLAEIVHDLDLKDERYRRPETAGIAAALDGIAASTDDDLERIERAAVVFDGLLAEFGRR